VSTGVEEGGGGWLEEEGGDGVSHCLLFFIEEMYYCVEA